MGGFEQCLFAGGKIGRMEGWYDKVLDYEIEKSVVSLGVGRF